MTKKPKGNITNETRMLYKQKRDEVIIKEAVSTCEHDRYGPPVENKVEILSPITPT